MSVSFYGYESYGNLQKSGLVWGDATLTDATDQVQQASNPYRFSTKWWHSYSGLYDYGLRFYSSSLGRFINRDPIGGNGGLNLYGFCANNPVNFVDGYGLSFTTFVEGFALGAAIGFMAALVITASVAIVTAAFPALAAAIEVVGGFLGAMAVQQVLEEAWAIFTDPHLCPDVRDFRLGQLIGGIFGAAAGAGASKGLSDPIIKPGGAPETPLPTEPATPTTRCFVSSTLIKMADGSLKPIGELKKDDWILSRNENDPNGKVVAKQVKQVFVHYVAHTLMLKLSSGEQIETTGSHRFYTEDKGWQKAKEFGLGTSIVTRAGPAVRVLDETVKSHEKLVAVYNFEVEDYHTYFVGNSGLWAHNADVALSRSGFMTDFQRQVGGRSIWNELGNELRGNTDQIGDAISEMMDEGDSIKFNTRDVDPNAIGIKPDINWELDQIRNEGSYRDKTEFFRHNNGDYVPMTDNEVDVWLGEC